MIKIIKNGDPDFNIIPTYQKECDMCRCLFEFTSNDVSKNMHGAYIFCPWCGRINYVSGNCIQINERYEQFKKLHGRINEKLEEFRCEQKK